MIALLALILLQESSPAEDHAWLRFKTGTWIRNHIRINDRDRTDEGIQTLTLTERNGDEYTIEEASTLSLEKSFHRTKAAVKTGTGRVNVDGKEIDCTIWTAKGERNGGATETTCWIPKGEKNPVRVTFNQAGVVGEATAALLKESVTVGDRTFSCVRLEGKVSTTRGKGDLKIWTSWEIPSAQVKMELVLDTPGGKVKFHVEAFEIHEEK